MARQTFSGVAGMARLRMPRGASASLMAFITADNPPTVPHSPAPFTPNGLVVVGTGWLVTSGNVQPGEIIELRFAVWDVGDGYYDSVVLLDDFQWNLNPSQPGTTD